ncbi:MAG: dihydropteroate synthase [Alphaproteobacteria bacterium]|nr:dihydropteroate synthase [Alphaproteobacteria bacterium]
MSPHIFGIVNATADSFSDGGKFLAPEAAIAHALKLATDGADVIDLGAAASNPDAAHVPPDLEIARLAPIVEALRGRVALSIDTFAPETQRWALKQNVAWLNDIQGFPDASLYDAIAQSPARLVVMHNVAPRGRAERIATDPATIFDRLFRFFDERLTALERAGIARERLVVDPGMGFFLGTDPEVSLTVLRRLGELKARYGLPLLISLSRKSFIRKLANAEVAESGPATLAAELFAAAQGADFVRTHDVAALKRALTVWEALNSARNR